VTEEKAEAVEETPEEDEFFSQPPVPTGEPGMSPEEQAAFVGAFGAEQHKREAEILTSIQYILEPHIPDDPELKKQFKQYEMLISKNLALANITRDDIFRYLDIFDAITLWLKFGQPNMAVKRICRMIMELQLTRSVDFAERRAQVTTRQVLENSHGEDEGEGKKKKKRFHLF